MNLAFYKDRTREYVSITGTALLSQDRALIGQLYAPDWKVWFEDEGGAYDGSPDDPRLMLIGVTVESARFLSVTKPQAVGLRRVPQGTDHRQGARPRQGPAGERDGATEPAALLTYAARARRPQAALL